MYDDELVNQRLAKDILFMRVSYGGFHLGVALWPFVQWKEMSLCLCGYVYFCVYVCVYICVCVCVKLRVVKIHSKVSTILP